MVTRFLLLVETHEGSELMRAEMMASMLDFLAYTNTLQYAVQSCLVLVSFPGLFK